MNPTIRVAREADLDALVHLAAAFRDHLGQSLPSDVEFRHSLARLLKDAGTEFILACDALGAALGYVQARYRYSAWTSALEHEPAGQGPNPWWPTIWPHQDMMCLERPS
jgi:hypothetical protein